MFVLFLFNLIFFILLNQFVNSLHLTVPFQWQQEKENNCSLRPLQWRHNGRDSVSNHQPREFSRLIRQRSKKTSKLRVTGLCGASNAENVSIWWRHHAKRLLPRVSVEYINWKKKQLKLIHWSWFINIYRKYVIIRNGYYPYSIRYVWQPLFILAIFAYPLCNTFLKQW